MDPDFADQGKLYLDFPYEGTKRDDGFDVLVQPDGKTVGLAKTSGVVDNPADRLDFNVMRVVGTSLMFKDGFESGTTQAWTP